MNNIDTELKSHFLNLYSVALSDTQVDEKELEYLFNFGKERGVEKEEIEELILHPDKIVFTIPEDVLKKIEYLYDFARMIWADNKVDEYELTALEKFCKKFGFEKENIEIIMKFLLEEAKSNTDKIDVINKVKENL